MNSNDAFRIWGMRRVFVSPAFGCPARCQFCYLESVGLSRPTKPVVSTRKLLDLVTGDVRFHRGAYGTVISLGCLSECLAPHAFAHTIAFLEGLASLGNPVQLATRWTLKDADLKAFQEVVSAVGGTVFHSVTEVGPKRIELRTPPWKERENFMEAISVAGIPSVLYVKPFLPGYTDRFAPAFVALARRLAIRHAVVGPVYWNSKIRDALKSVDIDLSPNSTFSQTNFPVSGERHRDSDAYAEVEGFRDKLTQGGLDVFSHSLEALFKLLSEMANTPARHHGKVASLQRSDSRDETRKQ